MDSKVQPGRATVLLALREQIKAEISASTETDTVSLDGSMGRISRVEALQRQQMAKENEQRREERLLRVDSALLRLQQGTYGLCGRCRRPIEEARLEAMPEVVLCITCASARPS
jgi:DnaK suppressor protein